MNLLNGLKGSGKHLGLDVVSLEEGHDVADHVYTVGNYVVKTVDIGGDKIGAGLGCDESLLRGENGGFGNLHAHFLEL